VQQPKFRWLLAVPVLVTGVAGYTLIDFIGSVPHLRGLAPPQGDFGAAIDDAPFQRAPGDAAAARDAAPMAALNAPAGSSPPGRAATEETISAVSSLQQAMPPESESALVPGEVSPDVDSGIETSPDDPTRDERRARTYELLEIAKSSGDFDGSIRRSLQDAVRDPDSEIAYLARSALWQLQAGQDRQTTGSSAD
jgi:hypothetical protein